MSDDVDYGPLAGLIGVWKGDKGLDVAPEPDGTERNPYYETITYSAIGDVTNAEEQTMAVLHYRQIVQRKSNDKVFHDQTGYWTWDPATDTVMQSLTIPRAVCVLASGKAAEVEGSLTLEVSGDAGDIVQSPFMQEKARTTSFTHKVTVHGDKMTYGETTMLEIYGRTFEHTDENELERQ